MEEIGPAPQVEEVPVAQETQEAPKVKRGIGLRAKIVVPTVLLLFVLAAIAAFVAYQALREEITDQQEVAGLAIATGLASSVGEIVRRAEPVPVEALGDPALSAAAAADDEAAAADNPGDEAPLPDETSAAAPSLTVGERALGQAERLRELIAPFARLSGVAYIIVDDLQPVSTFAGALPEDLRVRSAEASVNVTYTDPTTGELRNTIDIRAPIAGESTTVRVGMDLGEAEEAARRRANWLAQIVVVAALIVGLISFLVAGRTVRPLNRLTEIARNVGHGDLSTLAPVTSRDEAGVLAAQFNDTIVRLRGLVQTEDERDEERHRREALQRNISRFLDVATEIAGGDLTRRGEVTTDVLGNVVDAINLMVEDLGEILKNVRQAATTVDAGAREMIGATDEMVVGVQVQVREAQRVAGEVTGVTDAMRDVSSTALSSATAASETRKAAEKGQQAVAASLERMQSIRREVQGIARHIKSLGDRSLEVSEIVDTISSIASQTNLLALNAAIEAAGAGDAGARFAVVADEVRKLAEDSARSSKRISALIKDVQSEVQEAVVAMEEGVREVESGFQVTHQAGEQLREIAAISTSSAGLAEQISSLMARQVGGVEKVAASVQSIAEVAASTESAVVAGRHAAEQLVGLSAELNRGLARFQL